MKSRYYYNSSKAPGPNMPILRAVKENKKMHIE